MEPLELEFSVACSAQRAFELWATETSLWWPRSHSVSGAVGLTVTFEPRPGGRIYERTPDGVEQDWGEVLVWEPPHRLAYLWHLRFDRRDATEVEITFTDEHGATTVNIVHRGWERLGATARTDASATDADGPESSAITNGPAPSRPTRALRARAGLFLGADSDELAGLDLAGDLGLDVRLRRGRHPAHKRLAT